MKISKGLLLAFLSLLLLESPAVGQPRGQATISRQEGSTTKIIAEARAYSPPKSSGDSPVRPGGASSADSPMTASSGEISSYGGVSAQEDFAPLLDTDPCRLSEPVGPPLFSCYVDNSPEPKNKKGDRDNDKPAPPSPEQLARIAVDRAVALAPIPELRVAPARIGLTGLESYFWLEEPPRPVSAGAQAAGLNVTAEAHPVQFVWDFGDGKDLVSNDSGRPWAPGRPGSISHTYETKGSYRLSIEVIWQARWRVNGGPWTSLGHFSNSDSRPYRVQGMVAVLVPPRQ